MKIAEIVTQLATVLPLLSTDRYTESVAIFKLSGDGAVASIQTTVPHGLVIGSPVYITNVAIGTRISSVVLTANVATIETVTDHDLTLGWPPHATITLSGFSDSAFNDTFTLSSVPNRRKFSIDTVVSLTPPVLTGSEKLLELVPGGFNGTFQVATVVSTFTFTFASTFTGASSGGDVVTQIRIAGAVSSGRAQDEYTRQASDDLWLFVTQPDIVSVSKDRRALGDAVSEQGPNTSYELDIIDGFTVWCFVPASTSKAGLEPSDIARDDVLRDLLLSIQRYRPTSGLAHKTPSRVILRSHGPAGYDGAVYIHEFVFEIPLRMSGDDTLMLANTVAFRDVDLTIENPDSNSVLTALINLDEVPIA